jgi:transposase-like protein
MRHIRREEWRKLLASAQEETATEIADRLGCSPGTVCRWRRLLAEEARAPRSAALKMIELRPVRLAADDRFEVRLAGGRSIGVPPSFDGPALERLLRVLEAAS